MMHNSPEPPNNLLSKSQDDISDFCTRLESQWKNSTKLHPCQDPHIRRRLLQIILRRISRDFIAHRTILRDSTILEKEICAGLLIDLACGRITPSTSTIFKELIAFFIYWICVGTISLIGIFNPRKDTYSHGGTLVLGIGKEAFPTATKNDASFAEYCSKGPIEPLSRAHLLLIQNYNPSLSINERIRYCRNPLFTLARGLPTKTFLSFIHQHLCSLFVFICQVTRNPILCLLAKDRAYHALASILNRHELIEAVIFTNSYYDDQPLWMTALPNINFKIHMAWYSTNFMPILYRGGTSSINLPAYRYLYADISWTWDNHHSEDLRALGILHEMRAVGPIVWSMCPRILTRLSSPNIGIFDVTPFRQQFSQSAGFIWNYYQPETMRRFIHDILTACDELKKEKHLYLTALLKPKRKHGLVHDPEYIEYLQKMMSEVNFFSVIDSTTNIFDFIASCSAVIVAPYSSPAKIAFYLKKPVVYYDPTGTILPPEQKKSHIPLLQNRESLKAFLSCNLNSRP
jgi:polysaccharide biosynthesis PFTS motif protein